MDNLVSLRNFYGSMQGKVFTTKPVAQNLSKEILDGITASIIAPGPFYFFIFDCHTRESIYASSSISEFYDVDPLQFKIETVFNNIHPEDGAHLLACESAASHIMLNIISREDLPHYKVSHCYRIKTKEGKYKMILHQGVTFSLDENGLMDKTMLIHTDISHITEDNNRLFSLIGVNGRPTYINLDPNPGNNKLPEKALFTNREKDVLRLMANGLKADQIADTLYISYNTVRTHKQNLLRKTNAKNSNELLAKAIQMRVV